MPSPLAITLKEDINNLVTWVIANILFLVPGDEVHIIINTTTKINKLSKNKKAHFIQPFFPYLTDVHILQIRTVFSGD